MLPFYFAPFGAVGFLAGTGFGFAAALACAVFLITLPAALAGAAGLLAAAEFLTGGFLGSDALV
jgi:hypothetical protein